jgi:hypothetical protein
VQRRNRPGIRYRNYAGHRSYEQTNGTAHWQAEPDAYAYADSDGFPNADSVADTDRITNARRCRCIHLDNLSHEAGADGLVRSYGKQLRRLDGARKQLPTGQLRAGAMERPDGDHPRASARSSGVARSLRDYGRRLPWPKREGHGLFTTDSDTCGLNVAEHAVMHLLLAAAISTQMLVTAFVPPVARISGAVVSTSFGAWHTTTTRREGDHYVVTVTF